jgi:Predicted permeases
MSLDLGGIFAVSGAAFITGFSKSGVPGIGILIPILAAMAMPARISTGFILPVLIEGDCVAVAYWRRKASWRSLGRVLPWTALGIVAGYFLMGALGDAVFKRILGAMILAIVALDLARRAMKVELRAENRALAAFAGILAGVFTMLANAAGPVMTIYLLSMKMDKDEFVGTSAWFYFIVNLFKLPFSIALGLVSFDSLKLDLFLLPLVLLGSFVGVLTMKKLPQRAFNLIAQILAIAGGIKLFF